MSNQVDQQNQVDEKQNSSNVTTESPRPASAEGLVWAWQFDPLEPERGVEITYGGKACAVAPTLNNATLLIDRLNRHDEMLADVLDVNDVTDEIRTAIRKRLDFSRPEFNDGISAALEAVDQAEGFLTQPHNEPADKGDNNGK